MALVAVAQVPEAFVEVTVYSNEGQCSLLGRRQRALYKNTMQQYRTMTTLGGFPIHTSDLLSRLDRGEEAWVPDIQSSEDSADEEPVRPTLKRLPKGGTWWDCYRSPVTYPSSDSSNLDDERESETEEEKSQRGGHRLIILHRNVLNSSRGNNSQNLKLREACKNGPQLKKHPWSQVGKLKSNSAEAGDIYKGATKEKTDETAREHPCPDCGQSFKSKLSLSNHQRIHIREKPYKCSMCGERFTAQKVLASHQLRHAEEKGYKHPNGNKSAPKSQKSPPVGAYKCPECEKCFKQKDNLIRHQSSHSAERPHKCLECGKGFIRKEHLTRHQKIHTREKMDTLPKDEKEVRVETLPGAPEKKLSIAPVCERSITLHTSIARPQRIHTNLYKCQFCGRCLRAKNLLIAHERTHTEGRPHKCSQCKKSFHHKHNLKKHKTIHARQTASKHLHKIKQVNAKSSSSESGTFCTAESLSKDSVGRKIITRSFHQHPRIHTEKTLYKCQYCGKCASTRDALTSHEKIHRRVRPYKCHECGECFRLKYHLVRHQATHTRQKPCKHIKPVRKLRANSPLSGPERRWKPYKGLKHEDMVSHNSCLTRHPNIPRENNHFKCQYCGKCMRAKSSLVSHERIHKGKKPYRCLECGKNFSQKTTLGSHQRSHVRKKPAKCSSSDKKLTIKNLALKLRSSHRRKLPYLCLKCGKSFMEKYYFTRHQRIHSRSKPYNCSTCGKGFIQTWHLKRHQKVHLKGKSHQQPFLAEVNHAFSSSANSIFSLEKDRGDLPGNNKSQMTSGTAERSSSQNMEEEERGPLEALREESEMRVCQGSESGEIPINVQAEPQMLSSRKSKGKAQQKDEEVSVGQLVKLKRKLARKESLLLRDKQGRRCSQRVQLRESTKRERGLQLHQKEKAQVAWRLGSQAMAIRKSRNQARSCFCQQKEPEMMPGRKSKASQTCRKVKACVNPQKRSHTRVSPQVPKSAPKPGKPFLDQPPQRMFSAESKMAATESPAGGNLACVEQEMESLEMPGPGLKGKSVFWSCQAKTCKSADVAEQAELQGSIQPANKLKSNPGNWKKGRTSVRPRGSRRAISKDPQSRAPTENTAGQTNSRDIQDNHICTYCKKSFRSRGNLLLHEKNHKQSRPFLCTHCGKSFFGMAGLAVHMRIHTGEKPFKCSECNFCCNVSSNLSRHKRTHAQKRPHPCLQCGKRFWFKHGLVIHSKTHNKKEPHQCHDCGRVFTQENFLKLHRRYKHNSEAVELPHPDKEPHLSSPDGLQMHTFS